MPHRIIFFGSSSFGLPAAAAIRLMSDVEIVAVISQPAKAVGRHQHVEPTAVARWAQEQRLSLLTPSSLKTTEIVDQLKALNPDTFIVAAYGLIVPPAILELPKFGSLNIHASLLPKYRGASPIAAAIVQGDEQTGVTIMNMDAGLDTGPLLASWTLPITPNDTTPLLQDRLATLAAKNLPSVLAAWWSGNIQPQRQAEPHSYAPRLTKDDGRADWQSAVMLERKIRAYHPWPGVWASWRNTTIKILSATVKRAKDAESLGTIIAITEKPGWGVVCGDGLLLPTQIQLAGKKVQLAETLPGSYPRFIGSSFG